MKRIIICLIILLSMVSSQVRTYKLTLHLAKSPKPEQKYRFLVKADEQNDADAAPLYEKAVQSLPSGLKMDEIEQWLKTSPEELPRKKVQSTLQQLEPSLEFLDRASMCKRCEWPYLYGDELSENLSKHRKLVFFLSLKVRFQIANGQYDNAIGTMQTGFGLAKHFGEDTMLIRGMVGIGMAAYMCRQIEQFVQGPDAPNLYQALQDLPKPFIDLNKQAEWEEPDIKGKVNLIMNRLDRHIAVLQCIEAIRLYAGSHNGKFPEKLGDVTNTKIPVNPITQTPFSYKNTGSEAVIELESIEGRYAVRYELELK